MRRRRRRRLRRHHRKRLTTQPRIDLRYFRSILRLPPQAPGHHLPKRRRQIRWQHYRAGATEQPQRLTASQRLAKRNAQGPHVAGRRATSVASLGRVIDRQGSDIVHFTRWPDRITRELQLIADDEKVRWLDPTEHELLLMQEHERAHCRHQHFARLVFGQRATLQQLRQILVGVLHHGIQVAESANVAPPHVEEPHEMRMRHGAGHGVPARKL